MQHVEINTGLFGIYIVLLVHHVADIKYDTEWCDYAQECCRIL